MTSSLACAGVAVVPVVGLALEPVFDAVTSVGVDARPEKTSRFAPLGAPADDVKLTVIVAPLGICVVTSQLSTWRLLFVTGERLSSRQVAAPVLKVALVSAPWVPAPPAITSSVWPVLIVRVAVIGNDWPLAMVPLPALPT